MGRPLRTAREILENMQQRLIIEPILLSGSMLHDQMMTFGFARSVMEDPTDSSCHESNIHLNRWSGWTTLLVASGQAHISLAVLRQLPNRATYSWLVGCNKICNKVDAFQVAIIDCRYVRRTKSRKCQCFARLRKKSRARYE